MKGSPSKCIESKIDVIGPENILFAGSSCIIQPGYFTGCDSEGVNLLSSSPAF